MNTTPTVTEGTSIGLIEAALRERKVSLYQTQLADGGVRVTTQIASGERTAFGADLAGALGNLLVKIDQNLP
jgi:hypothetical protein